MDSTEEKQVFIARIMEAIEELGYPSPGFYVDDNDLLCNRDGHALISVAGDSPTAMIKDLAKAIEIIGW